MNEAFVPLSRIVKRVEDLAKKHGLILAKAGFTVGSTPEENEMNLAFLIDPDFEPKTEDPFDEIAKNFEEEERKERAARKADEARKSLEHLRGDLQNPENGIGL